MRFAPRLLGIGLLSLLVLLMMSCEATKQSSNEFGSPKLMKGEAIAKVESREVVHFTDSTAEYATSRSELATAFIREFGDGTVVDKVQVRKAPVGDGQPVTYYLIGMGLRNGGFRAMALPLTAGGDNTYYLRPGAERYILTGVGCAVCFFNFENGRIVSTTCSRNLGGGHCDLKVEVTNSLFAAK
ncbi:hypothetical protein [Hymenobacter sp. IS2118]|uniref:hypothetical protein n=1 Tax=Hymenobacter sp. IS2118 TaxID=1505605 RepID=UPI0012696AC3|nr:hypothetical protein [Hymenobacter sp. IS2118]